jgi:hypothetical protein
MLPGCGFAKGLNWWVITQQRRIQGAGGQRQAPCKELTAEAGTMQGADSRARGTPGEDEVEGEHDEDADADVGHARVEQLHAPVVPRHRSGTTHVCSSCTA